MNEKVTYIDYDKIREKGRQDWRYYDSLLSNDLRDKLVLDKNLFTSLLLMVASNAGDKINKKPLEVDMIDILNYLYDKNNLCDVVSIIRSYNNE